MNTTNIFLSVTILSCILAGCGGGSDHDAPNDKFLTGLPGGRVLSSLSTTEKKTMCSSLENFDQTNPFTSNLCKFAYIVLFDSFSDSSSDLSAGEKECVTVVDSCNSLPHQCNFEYLDLSGCSATVEEYELCTSKVIEVVNEIVDTYSCKEAAKSGLSADITQGNQQVINIPECETIRTKCPALSYSYDQLDQGNSFEILDPE